MVFIKTTSMLTSSFFCSKYSYRYKAMEILILILSLVTTSWGIAASTNNGAAPSVTNTTDLNKDMYVIHAMVYQIGIITNKTENSGNMTGDQESLTLYRTNGSNIDLSGLPPPLLTNVTAQTVVGVAPVLPANSTYAPASLPWARLKNFASLPSATNTGHDQQVPQSRNTRASGIERIKDDYGYKPYVYAKALLKRPANSSEENQDAAEKTAVKIIKGTAVLPQEAGVQSLAIPPLLTLNNNFSEIPVPIPNTSVVHYAKVNTLIREP